MKSKTLQILEEYMLDFKEDLRPTSKTLSLMKMYMTVLEQGESPPIEDPTMAQDPNAGAPPQEGEQAPVEAPVEEEPAPETSVAENQYVADLINAALFKPSPYQKHYLLELQNVMSTKQYDNAREDILPLILPMIRSSGEQIPVNDAPDPANTMPLTPEGEDQYISDLIDAALFEPSSEDANTLLNLQSVMKLHKYTNSREEVLPTVLSIIGSSTQAGNMKQDLNSIS
jgi:hypothetical protein